MPSRKMRTVKLQHTAAAQNARMTSGRLPTEMVVSLIVAKILFFQWRYFGSGATEDDACRIVSERYTNTCGVRCNPETCLSNNSPTASPTSAPEAGRCGCFSYSQGIRNRPADGATCGERIQFLGSEVGGSINSTWYVGFLSCLIFG